MSNIRSSVIPLPVPLFLPAGCLHYCHPAGLRKSVSSWVLKVGAGWPGLCESQLPKHLILVPQGPSSHLLFVKAGGQTKVTKKACPDHPVGAGWLFRKEKGSLVTNNLPFPGDSRQAIEKALVVNIMKRLVHSVVVSCRKYTNKARKGN